MRNRKGTKKENVTLREKTLSNGNISLYLDIYRSGKRNYEFLKLYVIPKPRTPEERIINKQNLELAENIRTLRESELNHNEFDFVAPHKQKINFLLFYQNYIDTYTKKDIRMIKNSLSHFQSFLMDNDFNLSKGLQPNQIDRDLVIGFKEYLESKFNGLTPSSYFKRFKKVLNNACDNHILRENPAKNISITESNGLKKEILNFKEIQSLANAYCGNSEVKRAFLFCCNTGLRFCDIKDLKFKNIDLSNKLMRFTQSKTEHSSTNSNICINLNNTSINLIGEIREPDSMVFKLPSIESSLRTLKMWCKRAGIDKNVTWHSSRHSFAVNLLSETGANIKTVSSLLGHSSLRHTEVYTRVIDKLKENAVNALPEINF